MMTTAEPTPSTAIKKLHAKFGMGTALKPFARALAGTDKSRVNLVHAWFANKAPRAIEQPRSAEKLKPPEKPPVLARKR